MYNIFLKLTNLRVKSVQVMVRLHIFPIFSFLAKIEKTTFLPEMKMSEKYASGP